MTNFDRLDYALEKIKFKNKEYPEEYIDDILVRLAHHSTAIEGNTISLADTVSILLDDKVFDSKGQGVSLREIQEVLNHKLAFAYILDAYQNHLPISTKRIRDIHYLLNDHLLYDRGHYKQSENQILGAEFNTASPHQVPMLMEQLVNNYLYRITDELSIERKIEAMSEMHIQFERIHPFTDGNGRTGRMILNYLLLSEQQPFLIIQKEERPEYFHYLANQEVSGFTKFVLRHIDDERKRKERFIHKAKQMIPLIRDPKTLGRRVHDQNERDR